MVLFQYYISVNNVVISDDFEFGGGNKTGSVGILCYFFVATISVVPGSVSGISPWLSMERNPTSASQPEYWE